MTWVVRHKRSPGSLIAAEYQCSEHERFMIRIEREPNGDPPERVRCIRPATGPDAYGMCGNPAIYVISAPGCTRVQRVTAARRGKDPERPPGVVDWQALAYEEKSPEEWHAAERKKDWEDTRKIVKAALR